MYGRDVLRPMSWSRLVVVLGLVPLGCQGGVYAGVPVPVAPKVTVVPGTVTTGLQCVAARIALSESPIWFAAAAIYGGNTTSEGAQDAVVVAGTSGACTAWKDVNDAPLCPGFVAPKLGDGEREVCLGVEVAPDAKLGFRTVVVRFGAPNATWELSGRFEVTR